MKISFALSGWSDCDPLRAALSPETCFKGHRCFSKNLFMSIRHMEKKEIPHSKTSRVTRFGNAPGHADCLKPL